MPRYLIADYAPHYQKPVAAEQALPVLSESAYTMWHLLVRLNGHVNGILTEPEEYPDILDALRSFVGESDTFLGQTFVTDERVQVTLWSDGSRWEKGAIVRAGRILKNGQTEYSYLVTLDEPLKTLDEDMPDDKVLNTPHFCLTSLS
jgi:hypothetical protein